MVVSPNRALLSAVALIVTHGIGGCSGAVLEPVEIAREVDAGSSPEADAGAPGPDAGAQSPGDRSDAGFAGDAEPTDPDAGGARDAGADAGEGVDGGVPIQRTSIAVYWWGHSLVDWVSSTSEDTRLGTQMGFLARAGGVSFCGNGMWSSRLAPTNFEGYPGTDWPSAHAHEPGCPFPSFAGAEFTDGVITENNFTWVSGATSGQVQAAVDLIDRIRSQAPGIRLWLYEHWPEWSSFDQAAMNRWLTSDAAPFAAYFDQLQDEIRAASTSADLRLVPAGRIIAGLLGPGGILDDLGYRDIAEDDAPHGTPTLYFLAGAVHYAALFQRPLPASYAFPANIDDRVRDRWPQVRTYIWSRLLTESDRVWDR